MPESEIIAKHFDIGADVISANLVGNGLIHRTWKVETNSRNYVLQQINENVFKNPQDIDNNIQLITDHISQYHPANIFPKSIKTKDGGHLVIIDGIGSFRMFEWIEGSHSISVVRSAEQAYEAASQFGKFTKSLAGLNPELIKITIPGFHDLSLRFEQFIQSTRKGNPQRIQDNCEVIDSLMEMRFIVDKFRAIKANGDLKERIIHHDTKISNVLFDSNDKGVCVIDLDTVMPGYFISDVGDMMRTYLSPANEEEDDFSKINVRREYYTAIITGYSDQMGEELTEEEKSLFFYSGQLMIYMQALRFMTDHLNDDKYYGARYEGHNMIRAMNQLELLKKYNDI